MARLPPLPSPSCGPAAPHRVWAHVRLRAVVGRIPAKAPRQRPRRLKHRPPRRPHRHRGRHHLVARPRDPRQVALRQPARGAAHRQGPPDRVAQRTRAGLRAIGTNVTACRPAGAKVRDTARSVLSRLGPRPACCEHGRQPLIALPSAVPGPPTALRSSTLCRAFASRRRRRRPRTGVRRARGERAGGAVRGTAAVNTGGRADPGAHAALFTSLPLRHNGAAPADAMPSASHRLHPSARRLVVRAALRNIGIDAANLTGGRRSAGDPMAAETGTLCESGCPLDAPPA